MPSSFQIAHVAAAQGVHSPSKYFHTSRLQANLTQPPPAWEQWHTRRAWQTVVRGLAPSLVSNLRCDFSNVRLDSTFDFSPDKKFAPPKPFNYNQPSAYGLTRKLFQWLLDTVCLAPLGANNRNLKSDFAWVSTFQTPLRVPQNS